MISGQALHSGAGFQGGIWAKTLFNRLSVGSGRALLRVIRAISPLLSTTNSTSKNMAPFSSSKESGRSISRYRYWYKSSRPSAGVASMVTFWVMVVDGWLVDLGVVVLCVSGGCVGWVVVSGFVW